jgi:acyl-CoA thioesterase-2
MGDLAHDTAVRAVGDRDGDPHYRATLSKDWEIWGPMGGYVAAIALRAAGDASPFPRPTAFSCHYLGVAAFGDIDVQVQTRRQGRTALSQRVEISQDDRPILDAMVWSVADGVEGLEHDETVAPDVPGPGALPEVKKLLPVDAPGSPSPFWKNIELKPLDFELDSLPDGPRPARWQQWVRFIPTPTYDDPWVDGARTVILVDLPSWPSARGPHAWENPPFRAPTLDLNVAFHQPTSDEEWLFCDGAAPLSTDGLFGWTARVWSPAGRLHASGGGQCLYRKMAGSSAQLA